MAVISWHESLPSNDSEAQHTDDEFRSLKTTLRTAIGSEHEWTSSGGTQDAGAHRLGSARGFYDTQSNLSASNSTRGRLYVASDTSRLFYTPQSGATQFVGSFGLPEVVAYGATTNPTAFYPGQNIRWVIQCGDDVTDSNGSETITFNPLYNGRPLVFLQTGESAAEFTVVAYGSITTRQFQAFSRTTTGVLMGSQEFMWMSLGTVTF